jgi:transcriptional regulator of aromatic amino acid metabolism
LVGNSINQAAAAFLRSPTLASVVNTYIDTTQSNAELSLIAFSMVRSYTRGWGVFLIRIPPLRERPEDIPLPVRSFTRKYGRRMSQDIQTIPAPAMKKLIADACSALQVRWTN